MSNSPQESEPKKLKRVVGEKTGALSPDDSVQTAGDRMRAVDANVWPVAEGRKLVGVIDQPDPDRQAGGRGHDPNTTRVGDTMRHDAVFCYEDDDATTAERIMAERNLNHLPVVDRQMRIVGIISREDVKSAEDTPGDEPRPPTEDWKPGETRSDEPARPPASPRMAEVSLQRKQDGGSDPRGYFGQSSAADAERFPFQAAVGGPEVY
jgi:CBS domain-containing protein